MNGVNHPYVKSITDTYFLLLIDFLADSIYFGCILSIFFGWGYVSWGYVGWGYVGWDNICWDYICWDYICWDYIGWVVPNRLTWISIGGSAI